MNSTNRRGHSGPRRGGMVAAACAALFGAGGAALAQEAINTPAATQPAAGRLYLREQFRLTFMDDDPTGNERELTEAQLKTSLTYGITGSTSVQVSAPVVWWEEETPGASDQDVDMGDVTALFRWRFAQWAPGPIDTVRLMVYGGAEASLGRSDLYADAVDPLIGAVATIVHGRHGLNLNASWKFTTDGLEDPHMPGEGQADLLRADAAYLFRLAPSEYTSDTKAAWYAVCELNSMYETNGDAEVMLSPGILYEGTAWAAEVGVQLPVWSEVEERLETEVVFVAGIRVLF